MLLILYWIMTLCCCLYAACAGGSVGRIGAGLIVFKTVAGFYTSILDQSWGHTLYPVLSVDVICLVAFVILALQSNRHWPLWTSGCALAAVAVHLGSIAQIGIDPKIYHGLRSLWAFPMQLFMVRGIVLDIRYRRSCANMAARALA
ncbi:hypothetical protein [Sphingobium sp. YBL2]|uniref:hypothetical protein n=1 Tax=Sphingobium sp. (strain YBL2) TaxID=484429 RepID=UPI0006976F12|nr:hypothetical protein [Sphingobium sp. YBL2]PNP95777.1 hypothetical protein A8G00_23745 [Sphingobium sp. SA916]